jgi:hypothetical protein
MTAPTCPWCGHDIDCEPGTPGESAHHMACCLDRHNPACLRTERQALDRIMRDEREDRERAS